MFWTIFFDILIVGAFALGIVIGIKKGFIKTASKPLKYVLTLVLTFSLASPVGNAIIKPIISGAVTNQVSAYLTENFADISSAKAEQFPTLIKLAAGMTGVNLSEVANGQNGAEVVTNVVSAISDPLVGLLSTVIAFILLYFLFKIGLSLVINIINVVFDKGVTGVVNKVLGCIFMTGVMFAAVWIFVSISEFIVHLPAFSSDGEFFRGGFIYNFFKMINPIDLLLKF